MLKPDKQPVNNGFHHAQALSILSIILFYLWPKVFPNAYFGYDIFFVTSGFIMASNKPLNTIKRLKKFYFKHVKMLIPLHLIFVLFITLVTAYLLGTSYFINVSGDGMLAMAFTQNLNIYFQKYDLFNLMEECAYFLYTWILCNQLIFCLCAPFVSFFTLQTQKSVLCFLALCFASFSLHIFYSLKTNYYVTFFPNLWQYLIGTAVFRLNKNSKHQNVQNLAVMNSLRQLLMDNNKLYIISLTLLICGVLNPYYPNFLNLVTRSVVTFSTATLIFSYPTKQCNNLFDKFICYISNAFYSIYLVTLSVIFFVNQIRLQRVPFLNTGFVNNFLLNSNFSLAFVTLIISIITQEIIYKPLQKLSNSATVLLLGILYALLSYYCFYLLTYPID